MLYMYLRCCPSKLEKETGFGSGKAGEGGEPGGGGGGRNSFDIKGYRDQFTGSLLNVHYGKISIVPEEGWFGQPKYSTPSKKHSTLCRFMPSYSSFYL